MKWSADPSLNGLVDEFQIYDRALTAAEVATLAPPPAAPTGRALILNDAASGMAKCFYRVLLGP